MLMRRFAVALCLCGALVLAGCAEGDFGRRADAFVTPAARAAYLSLTGHETLLGKPIASGTVIAPGIAVTAAHAADTLPPDLVIGRSPEYDLLFFRTPIQSAPPIGEPRIGAVAVAYGHGLRSDVREVAGPVRRVDMPFSPGCASCAGQVVFLYQALGGEGFSGGPVFDRETGQLIGITFGYRDGADDCHPQQRLMYAYAMAQVLEQLKLAEMHPQHTRPPEANDASSLPSWLRC